VTRCPCGLPAGYDDCCGRFHAGQAAPTAETLMRSRYSAFVVRDPAYLLATWHPSTRPAVLELDATTRWLGLEARRHATNAPDTAGRETATVEFVARCRVGGAPAVRLHELSRFVREHGRWYYLDGEFPSH